MVFLVVRRYVRGGPFLFLDEEVVSPVQNGRTPIGFRGRSFGDGQASLGAEGPYKSYFTSLAHLHTVAWSCFHLSAGMG